MRRRRSPYPPPEPLTPAQQKRLDEWIDHLDVDLELAQRTFREHSVYALPPLPGKEPAQLRGAYARRAANNQ